MWSLWGITLCQIGTMYGRSFCKAGHCIQCWGEKGRSRSRSRGTLSRKHSPKQGGNKANQKLGHNFHTENSWSVCPSLQCLTQKIRLHKILECSIASYQRKATSAKKFNLLKMYAFEIPELWPSVRGMLCNFEWTIFQGPKVAISKNWILFLKNPKRSRI